MPQRIEHLLFGKFPIEVEFTVTDNECTDGCGHSHVQVLGLYSDGEKLEIIESQDITAYFTGKIVDKVAAGEIHADS